MADTIIVTGRGGAGKSTFTALAAQCLSNPPLVIDADPDQSLAQLLGADLEEQGVCTISDALHKLQDADEYEELASMPLAKKVDYLLNVSCLYEGRGYDLVTLGVKWTRGCYCAPNSVLQSVIPSLAKNYSHVLIDSPAGLEHVNRRIVSDVDEIFVLVDPSAKSIRNAQRLHEIADSIGISYRELFLVGNHRFEPQMEDRARGLDGATYLGRVERDEGVEDFDWSGKPLPDLPEDSPARQSVRGILQKAGVSTG
jgi:CO dehydrogenase maturation factor